MDRVSPPTTPPAASSTRHVSPHRRSVWTVANVCSGSPKDRLSRMQARTGTTSVQRSSIATTMECSRTVPSGTPRLVPSRAAPWSQGSTTVRSGAPTSIRASTSIRTAAVYPRLRNRSRRRLTIEKMAKHRAVTRGRSSNAAATGIAKTEKHRTDRRPRVRDPIEHAVRHVLREEGVPIVDRQDLMPVALWPATSGVPMVQAGLWNEHELPAARDAIGELKILAECVAGQSLVEAQRVQDLTPVSHVAARKELDLHPRARREDIVGAS